MSTLNQQSSSSLNSKLVIIGRPNVGKSTLFNRLLGRRRALVHDEPGVTRDRLEEKVNWNEGGTQLALTLVDTGGVGGERFAAEIEEQVEIALSEANLVIFLMDGRAGLTPQDSEIFRKLKQSGMEQKKPIIYALNKVDDEVHESLASDFYALGADSFITLSAEHGRGIQDLKELIIEKLLEKTTQAPETPEPEIKRDRSKEPPRIAIVGRPNVGKSTFINAILGQKRMITSPIAGTTVDSVDSIAELSGKPVVLIDTAGIRRKSKTEQGIEVLSVVQTKKALERADIAVLLLDGETGITDQDEKIGGLIEEAGNAVVLAINKWDTQRDRSKFSKEEAAERLRGQMAFLKFAPIVFVSAKEGTGFESLGDLIEEILHQRRLKIPTHEFTEWVRNEATVHNPENAKFFMSHQAGRHPPTFVCHVNDPERIHFSLKRHLVNALRDRWGFMGSPIRLHFVTGKSKRPGASATR